MSAVYQNTGENIVLCYSFPNLSYEIKIMKILDKNVGNLVQSRLKKKKEFRDDTDFP